MHIGVEYSVVFITESDKCTETARHRKRSRLVNVSSESMLTETQIMAAINCSQPSTRNLTSVTPNCAQLSIKNSTVAASNCAQPSTRNSTSSASTSARSSHAAAQEDAGNIHKLPPKFGAKTASKSVSKQRRAESHRTMNDR